MIYQTVTSLIFLFAGTISSFIPNRYAAIIAYAGLIVACHDEYTLHIPTIVFWGIATAIVTVLSFILPEKIASSRRGLGYIAGAALAGSMTGLLVSHAWLIIGAVAGALLGGIAYSKTPAGQIMGFPSYKFFNYLCAKGLPAVITMCIAGTALTIINK